MRRRGVQCHLKTCGADRTTRSRGAGSNGVGTFQERQGHAEGAIYDRGLNGVDNNRRGQIMSTVPVTVVGLMLR